MFARTTLGRRLARLGRPRLGRSGAARGLGRLGGRRRRLGALGGGSRGLRRSRHVSCGGGGKRMRVGECDDFCSKQRGLFEKKSQKNGEAISFHSLLLFPPISIRCWHLSPPLSVLERPTPAQTNIRGADRRAQNEWTRGPFRGQNGANNPLTVSCRTLVAPSR